MFLLGGGLGLPRSAFYVAWPAEELLCNNKHILFFVLMEELVTPGLTSRLREGVLWGKGVCMYMLIDLPDATNFRPGAVFIPIITAPT